MTNHTMKGVKFYGVSLKFQTGKVTKYRLDKQTDPSKCQYKHDKLTQKGVKGIVMAMRLIFKV